ncbi:MAG: hypothetical protein AAF797_14050 [Planctomycetota bacterium]
MNGSRETVLLTGRNEDFDVAAFRQAFSDITEAMNVLSSAMDRYDGVFSRVLEEYQVEHRAA